MYAPGYPPTAPHRVPSRAWIVSMRVLFCALSVFSIGMLLWAPLLRLAIVRRRVFDWWLTGGAFVAVLAILLVVGRDDGDAHGIDFVLIPLLLLGMLAAPVHYLVADVRHYGRVTGQKTMGGYVPPAPAPGYGYATTVPSTGQPGPGPQPVPPQQTFPQQTFPQPHYQQPQPPQQTPPPAQYPQPQRIDQVRAELDELSDYLRKEEGR
ncbi:hypothetical protein [Streptomyces sp. RKAG290]|uniref:hypothetical protein n=1 Tax=Streptomyces sp. RKAG290 TaxID=2888348 RepID=UPI002034423C|nr:hypothetical protein [Streptomyces sp. RKAG290]MCM2413654.1 hypothetical protein [Streptomyces sp. RKAG290]